MVNPVKAHDDLMDGIFEIEDLEKLILVLTAYTEVIPLLMQMVDQCKAQGAYPNVETVMQTLHVITTVGELQRTALGR